MVLKIGISLLCCAAFVAAVPFSPLRENAPADVDFDIVVITIDGPDSSDSSENSFYDAINKHFFNFQFPEFPGYQWISSSDKSSEGNTEVTEKPEVLRVTIPPVEASAATDDASTFTRPTRNAFFNFSLADLMSSIMGSILSGFVQTNESQVLPATLPETLKLDTEFNEPESQQILAEKPEMEKEVSEMEKRIEALLLENDSSENDLKHGGALKAPKPRSYVHEFHSAKNEENFEEDRKGRQLSGVTSPLTEQIQSTLNEEKVETQELSAAKQLDSDFDQRILQILETFENEIRRSQSLAFPAEKEPSKEETLKEVLSVLPKIKPEESAKSEFAPKLATRIVRENMEVAPFIGESEYSDSEEVDSSEFMSYEFVPQSERAHYGLPNFLSAEFFIVPVPKSAKKFNPRDNNLAINSEPSGKYYMPHQADSSEFHGLSKMDGARYDYPDFSDLIFLGVPPSPQPKNYNLKDNYPAMNTKSSEKYHTQQNIESSQSNGLSNLEQARYNHPNFSDIFFVPMPPMPQTGRNYNSDSNYPTMNPKSSDKYYMPQKSESSQFYGLSNMEQAPYNHPDFSDVVMVPAPPMAIPAKNYNPNGHYGQPAVIPVPSDNYHDFRMSSSSELYGPERTRYDDLDFFDAIVLAASVPPMNLATGHGHPIMAANPHPYAPYLWAQPQLPVAGFHDPSPLDFIGHQLMTLQNFHM